MTTYVIIIIKWVILHLHMNIQVHLQRRSLSQPCSLPPISWSPRKQQKHSNQAAAGVFFFPAAFVCDKVWLRTAGLTAICCPFNVGNMDWRRIRRCKTNKSNAKIQSHNGKLTNTWSDKKCRFLMCNFAVSTSTMLPMLAGLGTF